MFVVVIVIVLFEVYKNVKLMMIFDVDIDKSGKFKYVLIKVYDFFGDWVFKYIVRGYVRCDYYGK